jgi:AcrR family transcriptional regulator
MLEDTKELILRKAAKLFLESGYDATSMKKLAEATGMQAPGIYYYFNSKEEILAQLQEIASQRFRENVIEEVNKAADSEERIRILISRVIGLLINFGEIPLLMLQEFLPTKTSEARKKTVQGFTRFVRDVLRELAETKSVEHPIDPTVATFCLIAMTSWTYRWYDRKGRITSEALADHITRLFLYGFYAGEVCLREEYTSGISPLVTDELAPSEAHGKKDILLHKAAELFMEYGFRGTSLRKLAEATGVQTPAIYHYFKNKEEIISQLQEMGARRFRTYVIAEVDKTADPEEKIRVLMSRVVHLLINSGELPLLMVEDSPLRRPDKTKKKRAKEFVCFIRTVLEELAATKSIKRSVDSTVATFCLIAITSWICRWYNPNGQMDVQELTSHLMRMFFQGVCGEEAVLGATIEAKEVGKERPIMDGIMVLSRAHGGPALLGGRCSRCGMILFPKKALCPDCFGTGEVEDLVLSDKGRLATYTVVRKGLGSRKAPYAIGYIDTPEHIRLIAPLTGCDFDELKIGMEMEVVFDEETGDEGMPVVVYKYRPLSKQQKAAETQQTRDV